MEVGRRLPGRGWCGRGFEVLPRKERRVASNSGNLETW